MTRQDGVGRESVVSKTPSAAHRPARSPTISPRPSRSLSIGRSNVILSWIAKESLALIALSGAALTVIAELGHAIPLADSMSGLFSGWREVTHAFWRPPITLIGLPLHPDLIAALNVSAFMMLIGVGARLSASLSRAPLAPVSTSRFFDDQTWPSLLVFAALCLIFMAGHDANETDVLTVWGSKELGKYAFALVVTAGYFAGDFIGHRAFHVRLYRLAALVAILVAVNFALIYWPTS